jgi:hypothetical protein
LNDLLFILRKQGLRVPKDARTLLQTPRRVNTIQKLGGDYLYLGIESDILKVISTHLENFRSNNEDLAGASHTNELTDTFRFFSSKLMPSSTRSFNSDKKSSAVITYTWV